MHVKTGSVDAVIVWDAIARYYADSGEAVEIPIEQNIVSVVEVGVLTFTRQKELAEKFVLFAASERGRAIFRKHNYRVDAPGNRGSG